MFPLFKLSQGNALLFQANTPKLPYPRPLTSIKQNYSGLNLNQDKETKPQTLQIVRQGEATPYWFKFNPLYLLQKMPTLLYPRK